MLLNVKIASLNVKRSKKEMNLLRDIDFTINQGGFYTIMGKNGSGKSTLAKAIARLLDERIYRVTGKILFEGKDLLTIPENDLISIRKNKISYVFQDSINTFDPLKKIGYYLNITESQENDILHLLEHFRLPASDKLRDMFPFQASAGMLQRISIVLALLSKPSLLILDEPTSSIDTPVINLLLLKLREFARQKNTGILLITQDIILANKISDKIYVLENGTLKERPLFESSNSSN